MQDLKIDIPGFTIAAKSWGKPENPTILALHGWMDNANSFDLLAPLLCDDYYFIAVDLPGHGLSSHIPDGNFYHFFDGVFTVLRIIDALQIDKIHLLGHSMGACLASLVAGVQPDKFLSLTLIEGLGPFSAPEEDCQMQLSHYVKYALSSNPKQKKPHPDSEYAAKARIRDGYLDLKHAKILCERSTIKKNGQIYWSHDNRLLYPSPLKLTEKQILSCLSEISTKTLLVIAKQGFSFSDEQMQARVKAIRNISIAKINGGHHIHMENPKESAKIITSFLNN